MKDSVTIGILAGMGPRSTAPFVDLVIDKCQELSGAKYDLDFPHMLIYSLPTPFYIDSEMNHETIKKTIGGGLKKLESWGVSFVAMPCNSAHAYYDELAFQINIPLLDMPSETAKVLKGTQRGDCKRIAILATEMTLEAGMYQSALGSDGADVIDSSSWQKQVNQLILAIKDFVAPEELQKRWRELNCILATERVDTIVLACTDLNALDLRHDSAVPIVDAGACLAEAAVRRWLCSAEFPENCPD